MELMFWYTRAFNQDLGWCLDDDVNTYGMFDDTPCQSTDCGVTQGSCSFAPTPASSDAPTPAPPSSMSPSSMPLTESPTYTESPTPEPTEPPKPPTPEATEPPTPRPHSDDATTAGASLLVLAAAAALGLA